MFSCTLILLNVYFKTIVIKIFFDRVYRAFIIRVDDMVSQMAYLNVFVNVAFVDFCRLEYITSRVTVASSESRMLLYVQIYLLSIFVVYHQNKLLLSFSFLL